jgi:flagellar basal-body rod protein FlgG
MIRALSTAATALDAQQAKIEGISNDLANVNTDGYKRTQTEFHDLMYETLKEAGAPMGAGSRTPVGIQRGMGVKVGAAHKIFEQGAARITQNPGDLMIEGRGFLPVQQPNGEVAYLRTAGFRPDPQGVLRTSSGASLIPQITLPANAIGLTVAPDGEVRATMPNQEEINLGQIQLANFQNEQGLKAIGRGMYLPTLGSGAPIQGIPGENGLGPIMQGALEGSNVNVANSMVDMISAQRAYEMGTKVMSVADDMMGATVNIK